MGTLVPDANVLISFYRVGWFDALSFWRPEYELRVSRQVWLDEFAETRDVAVPEWLTVEDSPVTEAERERTALSEYDWKCLTLAEKHSGVLITRDKALKNRAENAGIETKWTDGFLKTTFESCGIAAPAYQSDIGEYIEDAYISDRVQRELLNAEKQEDVPPD